MNTVTTEAFVARLYEKTVKSIIAGKNDSYIINELETEGLSQELARMLLKKSKSQIKRVRGKAYREVAVEYLLKGIGLIVLGAIITGITYSLARGGGVYVVTTGLFAGGGIYTIIGIGKFLSSF
jgi:hypothetical protein